MSALRITAGTLRGRKVPVPRDLVRPTSERARQAYFNIVGERIDGARFLDLFSGTGIFALEAVSRGAASAVAVDVSRRHTSAIEKLAKDLGAEVKGVTAELPAGIKRLGGGAFDLVYADPPYDYKQYDDLLMAIDSDLKLSPEAVVALEHRRNSTPFASEPSRLRFSRRAEYGEVWISFFIA